MQFEKWNAFFMVTTISERINIEKSFKNGFKQPLEHDA